MATVEADSGWDVQDLVGMHQTLKLTSWRHGRLLKHYAKLRNFTLVENNSYDPIKLLESNKSASTTSTTAVVKSTKKGVSITQAEVGGNSQAKQKKSTAQLFADYYVFDHGKGVYSLHRHTVKSRHVRKYAPGQYYIREVHIGWNCFKLHSDYSPLDTIVDFSDFEDPEEILKFLKAGCTHRTEAERKNTPKSVLSHEKRCNKNSMRQQGASITDYFWVQGIRTLEPNSSLAYQLLPIKI